MSNRSIPPGPSCFLQFWIEFHLSCDWTVAYEKIYLSNTKTRAKVLLLHWCLVKDPWAYSSCALLHTHTLTHTHTHTASRWINWRRLIKIGWFSQLIPPRPGKTFLMWLPVLRHSWDDFLWKSLKCPKPRRCMEIPNHFTTAAIIDSQSCGN